LGLNDLTDSRAIALDLLTAVLHKRRALDDALAAHKDLAALPARDRGFARLLVAMTLRRLGEIDMLIDAKLERRPLPERAARARDMMRLGVAQLIFLDTAPHAAVDTAVAAMAGRLAPYRGLVNAVLRGIARDGFRQGDPARRNTPDWLWYSWRASFGEDVARRIAEAHLNEAALDITVKSDPDRWAAALDAKRLPTDTLRRDGGGPIADLPGFAEGAWWVQDAAATLPVRMLGDVAGKRIADLCAAPGGKAAQLAAAGADLTAFDISPKRVALLRKNLARLGLHAECRVVDARKLTPDAPFDAILLDAPCSGTGTIRRHPDIARLKTAQDLVRLSVVQREMLDAAAAYLAPRGTLVYAVCSLQREEGPDQIEALLARNTALRRAPLNEHDVPAEFITASGDLQTLPCHWPEHGGLDGFFAARLIRVT
jgi:16S rRNA (cytosine967-C5)-methyltransferase